jgi:hypothetical protein
MEQLLARLAELKAEGDAIMQQLMQAGMPPEQIMAAVEGGGQAMPQIPPGVNMGMGGQPGPDLPPGIPQGVPMNGGGGGIPPGLLGGR